MQLDKIYITRSDYGQNKGRLSGRIGFKGACGNIELTLNESLSQKIVAICADEMVAASKDIAANMTAEIINAAPELIAKQ